MKCTDLAGRIEQLRPAASARDVARLCLLLANSSQNIDQLSDDGALADAWHEADLRMRAATDQHAAITEELERLPLSDLSQLTEKEVAQLIRTLKIQSQVLRLYVGSPAQDR